jgi:beta-glucosidase
MLQVDGLQFRDLDRNGRLDPYEDWRLSPARRAADLVARMDLAGKAGLLMHGTLPATGSPLGMGQDYDLPAAARLIQEGVNSFITRLATAPERLAVQDNSLQELAEATRWGIPLTLSTDPRNQRGARTGASTDAAGFSIWPDPPGFGAIDDPALARGFGDIVRQEYRAVGIHMALSPQADLATEPRWARIGGTFGEDSAVVARQVAAYVEGLQGSASGVTPSGVAAVVKHFVGYGAAQDGWDSHSYYGRYATFPAGNFDEHLVPFRAAFAVHASAVMPTYSILKGPTVAGRPLEPVGANFSHQLLAGLLRSRERFDGLVISDWAVTEDCPAACKGGSVAGTAPVIGMPWGVESLSRRQRYAKAINAGVDQLGGTQEPALLVGEVRAHRVAMRRVDAAAARVLRLKFQLGLFENPYVDPEAARKVVGSATFQARADGAQRRALVLLRNEAAALPIKPGTRLYLEGIDPAVARAMGYAVADAPEGADIALVRVEAPHQAGHAGYFFAARQAEGSLDFDAADPVLLHVLALSRACPTVLVMHMDRPAILARVQAAVRAIVAEFGVDDGRLLEALSAAAGPVATLPYELPSSMAEVEEQASDLPHDTRHPLFPIHAGASW